MACQLKCEQLFYCQIQIGIHGVASEPITERIRLNVRHAAQGLLAKACALAYRSLEGSAGEFDCERWASIRLVRNDL
jgi:hypothetical protein